MSSNPPQGYPVTRAQPDDNKNQQYWTGLQAVLAVLARGVPRAVKFLGDVTVGGHVVSTQALAPTFTADVGAGTGPTITVAGTDQRGVITVLTGTAPTGGNAIIAAITFRTAYAAAPVAVVLASNAAAAALPAAGGGWVADTNTTTTGFKLQVSTTALAATTTYRWAYLVMG